MTYARKKQFIQKNIAKKLVYVKKNAYLCSHKICTDETIISFTSAYSRDDASIGAERFDTSARTEYVR